jgi:hypothetical protein
MNIVAHSMDATTFPIENDKHLQQKEVMAIQEELDRRRRQETTYTTPLQRSADMKPFLKEFYRTVHTPATKQFYREERQRYPHIDEFYKKLCGREVSYEDFWQRYEYRCNLERILQQPQDRDHENDDDEEEEQPVQTQTNNTKNERAMVSWSEVIDGGGASPTDVTDQKLRLVQSHHDETSNLNEYCHPDDGVMQDEDIRSPSDKNTHTITSNQHLQSTTEIFMVEGEKLAPEEKVVNFNSKVSESEVSDLSSKGDLLRTFWKHVEETVVVDETSSEQTESAKDIVEESEDDDAAIVAADQDQGTNEKSESEESNIQGKDIVTSEEDDDDLLFSISTDTALTEPWDEIGSSTSSFEHHHFGTPILSEESNDADDEKSSMPNGKTGGETKGRRKSRLSRLIAAKKEMRRRQKEVKLLEASQRSISGPREEDNAGSGDEESLDMGIHDKETGTSEGESGDEVEEKSNCHYHNKLVFKSQNAVLNVAEDIYRDEQAETPRNKEKCDCVACQIM